MSQTPVDATQLSYGHNATEVRHDIHHPNVVSVPVTETNIPHTNYRTSNVQPVEPRSSQFR